jgi:hypothetical protein
MQKTQYNKKLYWVCNQPEPYYCRAVRSAIKAYIINADKTHPTVVFLSVSSPFFTFFIIETVLPYRNIAAIGAPYIKIAAQILGIISPPLIIRY